MGENSKKSGEIGEKITNKILSSIGWKESLNNVSIKCNSPGHLTESGRKRATHGEDQIYIYHSPFHDETTNIVHISVKNNIHKYPAEGTLKNKFKEYINELQKTIDCAKYSPELKELSTANSARKNKVHSGLLIWLHNDNTNIESDIISTLATTRIEQNIKTPIYVIDNARASFLLKTIDDINRKFDSNKIKFFYPKIGSSILVEENRTGNNLPLELIASDIIPFTVEEDNGLSLVFYANQTFSSDAYKKLISYALQFSNGLVPKITIGMPDYNPTKHEQDAKIARMNFSNRNESIIPFSFSRSILSLLE
ncbi:GapS4a family protein [Photorhabdus akhurstii]|uniref:GapS4a family protein n=1 Tax=Photorhabdus akhurstii TaxID=171438 RepID=UPI000D4671FA|nr:hypothetical protein [Photorhabdus akhurstii]MBS9429350.1 hypothetical protein [Photorhabdus akhurstii]PQQ42443.1 hypothetical protein C6H65_03215 [Photorhabdus luminescens]